MKILATIFLLIPSLIFAQAPVNDVPCGAILIPVVTAANCVPTTIYKWVNATYGTGNTSAPLCEILPLTKMCGLNLQPSIIIALYFLTKPMQYHTT